MPLHGWTVKVLREETSQLEKQLTEGEGPQFRPDAATVSSCESGQDSGAISSIKK